MMTFAYLSDRHSQLLTILLHPIFQPPIFFETVIQFKAERLDSVMGKSLDTEKLGSVFGTRPDILEGIQRAAGKQIPLKMLFAKY